MFRVNEKVRMDEVEFEHYVMGSFVPLYHDAKDVVGKSGTVVLVKCI